MGQSFVLSKPPVWVFINSAFERHSDQRHSLFCANWFRHGYYLSAGPWEVEGKILVFGLTLTLKQLHEHGHFLSGWLSTLQHSHKCGERWEKLIRLTQRSIIVSASTLPSCTCLRNFSDINHSIMPSSYSMSKYFCVFSSLISVCDIFWCKAYLLLAIEVTENSRLLTLTLITLSSTSFGDKALVFQIGEGGCGGTDYNSEVK